MKFIVNKNCIGCGFCLNTCPEIFSMTDNDIAAASSQEIDAELADTAMDAMSGCPVQAIEQEVL